MDVSVTRGVCIFILVGLCLGAAAPGQAAETEFYSPVYSTEYDIVWNSDADVEVDDSEIGYAYSERGFAGSGQGQLPKFDSALGTLLEATVTFSYVLDGDGAWTQTDGPDANTKGVLAWDNESTVAPSVDLSITVEVGITSAATDLSDFSQFDGSGSVTASDDSTPDFKGDDAFGIGMSDTPAELTGGDSVVLDPNNHGNLRDAVVGTGSWDVTSSPFITFVAVRDDPNAEGEVYTSNPDVKVTATVQYKYIPEPATLLMLALGGLAFGGFATARKRRT